MSVANYTRGAQGQMVADYHQDYLDRFGPGDKTLPQSGEDRRDNRDPAQVGADLLAMRDVQTRIIEAADETGHWRITPVSEEDAAILARGLGRPVFFGDYVEGKIEVSEN